MGLEISQMTVTIYFLIFLAMKTVWNYLKSHVHKSCCTLQINGNMLMFVPSTESIICLFFVLFLFCFSG